MPEQSTPEAGQRIATQRVKDFEPLLTDAEAAELLGLHPKTIQRLARTGELPAVRVGRYWRFRASALNQ